MRNTSVSTKEAFLILPNHMKVSCFITALTGPKKHNSRNTMSFEEVEDIRGMINQKNIS